jgi:tetratricopeptide (TPR) repeat protein
MEREDGMRPSRRWWVFILAITVTWAGWWWLKVRRPRIDVGWLEGEANPAVSRFAPDVPSPKWLDQVVQADDAQPPAPPVSAEGAEAATSVSGLEDLSRAGDTPPGPTPSRSAAEGEATGPSRGEPSGFDHLPGIDDQLEVASVEVNPAVDADIRLGHRAQQAGKLADAERHLLAALQKPGINSVEAKQKLAEVYWLEGRFDEVRALAEEIWREAERAGSHREAQAMLRFHLALGLNPLPIDRMQAALDRAIEQAPQDDRVWLGRGYLALRDGRLAEAQSWLDACARRRPDDPAVWRARLEWAMATDRVVEAREALPHLGAVAFSPARIHELRAWFAARRGDADAERQALEQAVAADPGDLAALERLVELAARQGRAEDGARLRRRKAELDEALHRYRTLFREDDPVRSTARMASLAEALGRRFEALGLWTLVRDLAPADVDARAALDRLAADQPASRPPGQTLADALAGDIGLTAASVSSRSPSSPSTPRRVVPLFRDDAKAARLDFAFVNGATPQKQLPEASSGGVGLLDYDGDGRLDVYLVQGGQFPPSSGTAFQAVEEGHGHDARATGSTGSRAAEWHRGQDACATKDHRAAFGDRLFRNRGDGTFEDVTRVAGLAGLAGGYGHGVAVGDYDNDGRPDLFVTRWRSYALYHNRGDGTFEDATGAAGLGGDRDWPTSSAFADLDGDGDLDLYVCHYLAWDAEKPEVCRSPSSGRVNPCDPLRFAARPDHLFRNDGGRFVDVTKEAGIVDHDGRGLGVVAADLDEDGRLDLFVANDGTANFLFVNRGGMRFEEAGHESGVAAAGGGGYRAGMGIARGDLDGDGRPDLAVTNFFGESTTFYQNLGAGLYTDRTSAIGLAAPSRYRLGFGVAFLDADADGRVDLLTVNGHISDERPGIPYAMPAQLMLNGPGARLTDVSAAAGPPFQVPRLGRGLAVGDLDDDGRLDAIVVGHDGPVAYLHNMGPGGHWITIRLEGTASNRDAVGARVTVEAGGNRQVADRFGGGSYQSASDPRLHFGLGGAMKVDAIEIRWPSGRVDRHRGLAADAGYLIREGDDAPRLFPGHVRKTPVARSPG